MFATGFDRLLRTPVLGGAPAFVFALFAVACPTLIRAAMTGGILGCEFTPYLPFVLGAAILLRWWQAGLVALASVAVMGGLFDGSMIFEMPCFPLAAAIFLAASAMMVGIAIILRRMLAALRNRGDDHADDEIVFSLKEGIVWASWYGDDAPVMLGTERKVSEMMEDFLAQGEVARRLAARSAASRR